MKSENRYVRDFVVDGYPFRFLVTNANQLVLLNMTHKFDVWGDELPFDMYRPLGAELGAKVYRQCFKYALDAIFRLRLKTFWFSIGLEEKRFSLYDRLADRLSRKYGFYCYKSGGLFQFYRQ